MSKATQEVTPRVALVFDFDDTLAADSLDVLIRDLEADPRAFRETRVQPRVDRGWDPMPAAFFSAIELGRERGTPVTRHRLEALGRAHALFPGVPDFFERLRETADEVVPGVDVEFYVVSCGLAEIIGSTRLAGSVAAIYASRLHYDGQGEATFVERIVSHEEKTRYLHGISQGPPRRLEQGEPFRQDPDATLADLHVPFHQMIYVGDGLTDLPAFALMRAEGGYAIGVLKDKDQRSWVDAYEPSRGQRLANLARPEYTPGSELVRSLELAVRAIAHDLALARLGERGSSR